VIRIVPDSNVVISAYHFGGTPAYVIDLGVIGEIEIAISVPILDEVRRNLKDKFGWPEDKLDDLESIISGYAIKVSPSERVDTVKSDPADNRILECALEARAGYVVSGDNHLLRLKQFRDIPIVKPADFLKLLKQ
jgi:putative PIN family toxin of toxin-antitoxin system